MGMDEALMTVKGDIERLSEQIKGALRRIDEQKATSDAVYKLALSVERMTGEIKYMAEEQSRQRTSTH